MPWISVDCQMPKHEKMAALPSDGARWGWLVTLTEAKLQRNAGRFASRAHFRHVMGRYGQYVEAYLKAGLLEEDQDGALSVHDWRQHQWAASKARHREDDAGTSRGPNVDTMETQSALARASRAVTVPVDVSVSDSVELGTLRARDLGAGSDDPEWPAMVWLAQHKATITEGSRLHLRLSRMVEKHGAQRVIQTMASLGEGLEANQYILGADNALNPIPSGRPLSPKEERDQRIADARAEAAARRAQREAASA